MTPAIAASPASTAYSPSALVTDPSKQAETSEPNPNRDIKKVAKEFEAVFVSMLLKSMRESMSKDMFAGDSSDTFGGLFDSFLGEHIADQGGLGIGDMILAAGLPAKQGEQEKGLRTAADVAAEMNANKQSKAIEVYKNVQIGL